MKRRIPALLDNVEPMTSEEQIDALLEALAQQDRDLIGKVLDRAVVDETFRLDLADKLATLGVGKRGRRPPPGRDALLKAHIQAGFTTKEIKKIYEAVIEEIGDDENKKRQFYRLLQKAKLLLNI